MTEFGKIGIVARIGDPSVSETLVPICEILQSKNVEILFDHSTKPLLKGIQTENLQSIAEKADLMIVIGGDGTLLYTARHITGIDVPLLGINRGRLGFLTDINPEQISEVLSSILEGNYTEEHRFLLQCDVWRDGRIVHSAPALNDVVLRITENLRIIEFETYVDGSFVTRQRADGLIVSSPTGSTAYALSNGGPIMSPNLEAMVVLPICPHTLSSRPLIVDSRSEIEIILKDRLSTTAQVAADADAYFTVENHDSIRIRRKQRTCRLLHPQDYDFYNVLREKFNWA